MALQHVLMGVAMMMSLAGGVHAGEGRGPAMAPIVATAAAHVWEANYQVKDAQGPRHLRIVMDADRVEYRALGEPVRQWRRVADGVELREIDIKLGQVIVHAPGDLRLRGREPEWQQLRYWGTSEAAAGWTLGRNGRVRLPDGQHHAIWRWQPSASAQPQEWIIAAGAPVHYRRAGRIWRLNALKAVTDSAFTSSDGLEEIDAADVEDRLPDVATEATPASKHAHGH